jgi:hypothetical protein
VGALVPGNALTLAIRFTAFDRFKMLLIDEKVDSVCYVGHKSRLNAVCRAPLLRVALFSVRLVCRGYTAEELTLAIPN